MNGIGFFVFFCFLDGLGREFLVGILEFLGFDGVGVEVVIEFWVNVKGVWEEDVLLENGS